MKFYHLTKRETLAQVMECGIIPYFSFEEVYLTDLYSVPVWNAILDGDHVLLEVDIPDRTLGDMGIRSYNFEGGYSMYCTRKEIPAEWVRVSKMPIFPLDINTYRGFYEWLVRWTSGMSVKWARTYLRTQSRQTPISSRQFYLDELEVIDRLTWFFVNYKKPALGLSKEDAETVVLRMKDGDDVLFTDFVSVGDEKPKRAWELLDASRVYEAPGRVDLRYGNFGHTCSTDYRSDLKDWLVREFGDALYARTGYVSLDGVRTPAGDGK